MASRPSRPTRTTATATLLAALALVATLLALPASAQTSVVRSGTAAGTVGSGYAATGTAPTITGALDNTPATPDVTTITLNSERSVLNFDDFNLTAEDTLQLVFSAAAHSVLIRVNTGAAHIGGTVSMGTTGSPGNVVISAPDGVVATSQADVRVGSLLATTGDTTDTDFFAGHSTFFDASHSITLHSGAWIDAERSLGFVAPLVQQAATVGGQEALYGSASDFAVTYDGLNRLLGFTPSEGAAGGLVELLGTENGGAVAVSTLSTTTNGGILVSGTVQPSAPVASGFGYTALSAGGGLQRTGSGLQPVPIVGAAAQPVHVTGTTAGSGELSSYSSGVTTVSGQIRHVGDEVELHAGDDVVVTVTGAVSAERLAVVSTAADFVNHGGADAVTTGVSGRWVVYADDREGNTFGGLDSHNTALWGDTPSTRPPAQVSGNRYVFAAQPTLTFSSADAEKTYGDDVTDALPFDVVGLQAGEPGAFLADTPDSAFEGAPELSSPGAGASAPVPVPVGDTYPITIGGGTLASDAGYAFAPFSSSGRLSVVSQQPEDSAPVIVATVTGATGANDWYTSDVAVSWSVTDPQSGVWRQDGCDDVTVETDTVGQAFTCSAVSAGGSRSESVTIRRDATRPVLAPSVSPDRASQNGPATALPNATDPTSGIASASCDPVDTSILGEHSLTCTATDNAGQTNTVDVEYTVVPNKLIGFSAPVDNADVLNRAKAGQVIPLKWRFTDADDQPITSLTNVSVSVSRLDCSTGDTTDTIEQYASSAGSSQLQNLGDGYYQYNWQSLKGYAGTCKTVRVDVGDDTPPLSALFTFVK